MELNGVNRAILVGGGTGIAALYPIQQELEKHGIRTSSFLGAKDSEHLFYASKFNRPVHIALDDASTGDVGWVGPVTDFLEEMIKAVYVDGATFFNCGPGPMVERAEEIEMRYSPAEHIFSSAEELTRCGYGLCGECAREDGLRRCVDGYFMNPSD